MSIASTAAPTARRRFLSGVALVALLAGAAIAVTRLQSRLAPVDLASMSVSPPALVRPRLTETAAALAPPTQARPVSFAAPPPQDTRPPAPAAVAPQPGWERVMVAPELRVERVVPPSHAIVQERVLLEPERRVERQASGGATVVEIVPARYGYRERRVEQAPARTVIETIPAVWEWRPRAGAPPAVAPSG
jgi:hypothetical protein